MQWDFKNFVSLGLRIKEYDWTLEMINKFNQNLPEAIKQNAYTYNLANYYYETGDYKKATKLLNSVEFTDIYYNLDSKAMLLKIYYKVEEESFLSLVSSFGIYLRRNKLISKDNVEIYENLIKFTKKAFLLKTKLPYERKKDYYKKVETLKEKIRQTQKVININWLLGEVDSLMG
jgi:tetratricopeptide (TPR) repeat protein